MEEKERKGYSEYKIGNTPYYIYVFQDVRLIVLADESKEYGEQEINEWKYPHNINEEAFDKDYYVNELILEIEYDLTDIKLQVNDLYNWLDNELY